MTIFSTLFRQWWVLLIQGILMIGLSIIIFNNPDVVLAAVAFWLGATLVVSGLFGVLAYFFNAEANRELSTLTGSAVTLILGILMISKTVVTMRAITLVFGFLVTIIGWILLTGSWNGRKQWSLWWIIACLGIFSLIIGIKSIFDMYAGAEHISNLIGLSVLISGIGLVCLAFLKKKILTAIKNRTGKIS